jgi:hypothetical protein
VYLTIVLSTDTQNWHDYDAFQLPNSTGQYELIDMSHYREKCISSFLLIGRLMGAMAACAEVARGAPDLLQGQQSPELHMEPSVYGLIQE